MVFNRICCEQKKLKQPKKSAMCSVHKVYLKIARNNNTNQCKAILYTPFEKCFRASKQIRNYIRVDCI